MKKVITPETLRRFAYCNDGVCVKPVRGIVIAFFGLGNVSMFEEDTEDGRFYGEHGLLFLVPYQNPWGWMNRRTVAFVDELIDVLFEKFSLPEDTPVISTGLSMGGLSALVYTARAGRTPAACVANCPVCDLPYHYTERPDLPRTLYSAFGDCDADTLEEAMARSSPLHLADQMPFGTDYTIFHCEEDMAVNKQKHSDRFVARMRPAHRVTYYAVPGRGHCDLSDEMRALYRDCVLNAAKG